jgi:hypothetical protein
MFVGGSRQLPATAGLVHANVLPPAGPDTGNVPLHDVPAVRLLIVTVNVPANELAATLPPTFPFFGKAPPLACHVPLTVAPLCVRVIVAAWAVGPPEAVVVNERFPDQLPATLAGDGVEGALDPPQAIVADSRRQALRCFNIGAISRFGSPPSAASYTRQRVRAWTISHDNLTRRAGHAGGSRYPEMP